MEGTPIYVGQHRRGCAIAGSRTYFEDASLRHRPLGLSRLGSAAIGSDRCIICSRGGGAGPPGKLTRSVNCPPARTVEVAGRTGDIGCDMAGSRKLGAGRLTVPKFLSWLHGISATDDLLLGDGLPNQDSR